MTLILVTGGTGRLGRAVVKQLAGCEVRVLARHPAEVPPTVTFCTADLRSGVGVDAAMHEATVVINCASGSRGDAQAARNLVTGASRAGVSHLVHVSIVGIEHLASWGYPRAKLETERIVAGGGVPWTILRATQFYDYILDNARTLSRLPLAPVPAGFRVQPVDARDVAARLAELALGEPAGRVPDIAGPRQSSWEQLLRSYLEAAHRRRWVVPIRIPGTHAVRDGALLPPPGHVLGTRTWEDFLAARLQQIPAVRGGARA